MPIFRALGRVSGYQLDHSRRLSGPSRRRLGRPAGCPPPAEAPVPLLPDRQPPRIHAGNLRAWMGTIPTDFRSAALPSTWSRDHKKVPPHPLRPTHPALWQHSRRPGGLPCCLVPAGPTAPSGPTADLIPADRVCATGWSPSAPQTACLEPSLRASQSKGTHTQLQRVSLQRAQHEPIPSLRRSAPCSPSPPLHPE